MSRIIKILVRFLINGYLVAYFLVTAVQIALGVEIDYFSRLIKLPMPYILAHVVVVMFIGSIVVVCTEKDKS